MDRDEEGLRQSAMYHRWELERMSQTHPERAERLAKLAATLLRLFDRTAEPAALREAVTACRTAISLTPAGHANRDRYQQDLRHLLLRLLPSTTRIDSRDAGRALRWTYPSPGTPRERPAPVGALSRLAEALGLEYQQTDDLLTIRDAVETARRVVKLARPGDRRLGEYRANLGSLLWLLSGRDGDLGALEESLDIARTSLAILPPGSEEHTAQLNRLALILKSRYELTGDVGALREAADLGRDAVAAASLGSRLALVYAGNLADQLRMLSERTGDRAMAREAVLFAQEAITGLGPDDAERAGIQAVLGSAVTHLAVRTGDEQTIENAVEESEKAVAATPVSHPDYLDRLNEYYQALKFDYDQSQDPAVLERVLEVARDLAGTAPADHPDRGKYLSHLSSALRESFLRGTGNTVQELKEAAEFAKQAAASTPPNHPDRAANLESLADLLYLLFERTRDTAPLREFTTTSSAIAKMSGAAVSQRITAAQRAAQADLQIGRRRHAMTMISLAADLLPQLALRDVDRADREYRVSLAHRLPATAAVAAIEAGQPGLAVELLEQTRGVVFAGTLDTREDADELRRSAPDLLPEFDRIREEINAADHEITLPSFAQHRDVTGRHSRELGARRAALNQQWDDLLEEIRRRPGLEGFQRPVPVSELCRHASQGPVVYVVADESRAHALIVRDDPGNPVTVVDLPDAVTRASTLRQAEELRAALQAGSETGGGWAEWMRARREAPARILKVLDWTWENITGSVLCRLGHTGPPPDGRPWPRVWWCPVGPVGMLPLHASGPVMDRVVSSYTPTVRALAHARRDSPGEAATGLVVAVPDAPDSVPLDGVRDEAAIVHDLIPAAATLPADGGPVTREEVIEGLERHGVVHLACHGYANLSDPSASKLLLHDHLINPLTLHDITRLNLRHARLAYLSACSTTDTREQQADEATHLTAAFQLAGYRGVIGTLWPISDQAATDLARDFYSDITDSGAKLPDPGRAAEALHYAVRRLRDAVPTRPGLWAAHIHYGA